MSTSNPPISLKNTLQNAWRKQLPNIVPTLIVCLFIALAAITAVYLISVVKNVPPSWLTRDPNELVPGKHSWVGALSKLGYMAWTTATALCFIGAVFLRRDRRNHSAMTFLIFSGLLSLLLTLDDTFMLHESVFPQLHISEKIVFGVYLILAVSFVIYFFRRLLATDYIILFLSVFFIGCSIAIDQIFAQTESKEFIEDLPKFLGIVLWTAYFARTSFALIKDGLTGEVTAREESLQNQNLL